MVAFCMEHAAMEIDNNVYLWNDVLTNTYFSLVAKLVRGEQLWVGNFGHSDNYLKLLLSSITACDLSYGHVPVRYI